MCTAVLIGWEPANPPPPPWIWAHLRLIYEDTIGQPRYTTSLCDPLSKAYQVTRRVGNLCPAIGRGIDSRNRVWNWVAKQHRLAGRYDNLMPTWLLAPIAGLKLPTPLNSYRTLIWTNLHPVVDVWVDVDGTTEMIDWPAVGLVNGDLLLVRVADGQPRDVLSTREHAYAKKNRKKYNYTHNWSIPEPVHDPEGKFINGTSHICRNVAFKPGSNIKLLSKCGRMVLCWPFGKFVILRSDKILFTEYANPAARKSSKSFK